MNWKPIVVWVLRAAVAALFLFAGFSKLTGQPMMIETFDKVGVGQWFRYVTGLLEVGGAVAVLIPAVSVWAAGLLLLVDVGAFIAQVAVLHEDWIHTIVIGAVIAAVIYLQSDRLARA